MSRSGKAETCEADRHYPEALEHIAAVVCLNCGGSTIDANGWATGQAIIRCYRCGNEAHLAGFTLGRGSVDRAELEHVRQDAARLGNTLPKTLVTNDDEWEAAVCRLKLVPRSQLRPAEWDGSIHFTAWMDAQRSAGRGGQ